MSYCLQFLSCIGSFCLYNLYLCFLKPGRFHLTVKSFPTYTTTQSNMGKEKVPSREGYTKLHRKKVTGKEPENKKNESIFDTECFLHMLGEEGRA